MPLTTWLLKWPKSKTWITPNVVKDMEQWELSFIASKDTHCITTLEDTFWFLTNIFLPYDLAIPLLCVYPDKLETHVHTKTCIACWFIIAKTWKLPRCPLLDQWLNKLVYPMEYYLALKRNELSSHEKTWRNLKCIVKVKKKNQSENLI